MSICLIGDLTASGKIFTKRAISRIGCVLDVNPDKSYSYSIDFFGDFERHPFTKGEIILLKRREL